MVAEGSFFRPAGAVQLAPRASLLHCDALARRATSRGRARLGRLGADPDQAPRLRRAPGGAGARTPKRRGRRWASTASTASLAWVDFPEEWHRHYYNGLLQPSALWPLLHSFPTRVQKILRADWHSYRRANRRPSRPPRRARGLVRTESTVWVRGRHLLLPWGGFSASEGIRGPIGLFQHVPFPGPDILFMLPWAQRRSSRRCSRSTWIGFHYRAGTSGTSCRCVSTVDGARIEGEGTVIKGDHVTRVARVSLWSIIPEQFQESADAPPSDLEIAGMVRTMRGRRAWCSAWTVSITPRGSPNGSRPSARCSSRARSGARRRAWCGCRSRPAQTCRTTQSSEAAWLNIVGRVNGEHGEADLGAHPWRYLYRSYRRSQLSELYRAADVGYVTPLRDGMNLVAKEYVAAQDPQKPGVLVLSRFAGAAEELERRTAREPLGRRGHGARPEAGPRNAARGAQAPACAAARRDLPDDCGDSRGEQFLEALKEAAKR